MKPPVSGKPAKLSMNDRIATPSRGRSQPSPARLSRVTRSVQLPLARRDDCERAERSRAVRDPGSKERFPTELVVRRDRDQHEAGVRDRGVREEPLHPPLDKRGEVSDRERDAGDDRQCDGPQLVQLGKATVRTRSVSTRATAFVAADMNAVTGVGAPS